MRLIQTVRYFQKQKIPIIHVKLGDEKGQSSSPVVQSFINFHSKYSNTHHPRMHHSSKIKSIADCTEQSRSISKSYELNVSLSTQSTGYISRHLVSSPNQSSNLKIFDVSRLLKKQLNQSMQRSRINKFSFISSNHCKFHYSTWNLHFPRSILTQRMKVIGPGVKLFGVGAKNDHTAVLPSSDFVSSADFSSLPMVEYCVSEDDSPYESDQINDYDDLPSKSGDKLKSTISKKGAGKLVNGRTVEEVYQKKTQLEHILLRPDTYIGSVERQTQSMWVYDKTSQRMIQRSLSFVPGLFKIYDEILVNAADNKSRDENMDTMQIDIDRDNCRISIYNNGEGIPIQMHAKEKIYVPEMIFGHLLTSSNYNDTEKKVTGGRNGYGAKLCNIFSTSFIVETADGTKKYYQRFTNNMSIREAPKIKDLSASTPVRDRQFSRITFVPDLQKFGMSTLDDDIVALFERRAYDMAGCCAGVKVILNGERIKLKGFKDYVQLYTENSSTDPLKPGVPGDFESNLIEGTENSQSELATSAQQAPKPSVKIIHERAGERWEVCVCPSDGQFTQMSFVNAISTSKGGTHVSYVADQLVNALAEGIKKLKGGKDVAAALKPFQIKNHLSLFINCKIENPTFDSQTKENMTLRSGAFGSKFELTDAFVKKVLQCGIVENVVSWARFKQDQQLKKTDGAKRARLSGISKLDDANNAGTKNASKCTLILTEGDSAKALAVSGLSVVGRDNFGVYPLRGKLLNVREASHKQIMENGEINHIKQIMGLQHGKSYNSTDTLRYGSIMIMTDQDHDGSHIKGLIINFLDHFFPSLLRVSGFLVEFITPIVKVFRSGGGNARNNEISFYTIPEYEAWRKENNDGRGWNIKYYKGLGTSTSADAKKYFSAMDLHRKPFSPETAEEAALVDMAFNKKRADERKDWLKTVTLDTFVDHRDAQITIKDFINKELILFSMADNVRSIPSLLDGLKPGQRKILFSCFKRKLKGEIKVAQLAGYVSEHSAYHHGEASLCATIVGMAQNYLGSNNINLLEPIGQFGTRLQGGKDAASARYIYTSLSVFARILFREEDDALYKYLTDDGQKIEPSHYLPVIPLLLANGAEGIGTGWMTSIPSFNPRDIVDNILRLLDNKPMEEIHPWFRGFRGKIESISSGKYKVTGTWRLANATTLEVTELPVGVWTQSYKEQLESMVAANTIKDYKEHHTDTTVNFVITLSNPMSDEISSEEVEKQFKLSSTITCSNMVCFDFEGRIQKYDSALCILEEYFHRRMDLYVRRKEMMAQQLTRDWTRLDAKARFVTEIIDGTILVSNRRKSEIVVDLTKKKYPTDQELKGAADSLPGNTDDSDEPVEDSPDSHIYDYLLNMPIHSLTREKVDRLVQECQEKENQLNSLLAKSPKDLWRNDLDEFMKTWNSVEMAVNREIDQASNQSAAKANRKRPTVSKKLKVAKKNPFAISSESEAIESSSDEIVPKKKTTQWRQKPPLSGTTGNSLNTIDKSNLKVPVQNQSASTGSLGSGMTTHVEPAKQLTEQEIQALPISQRIAYMLGKQTQSYHKTETQPKSTLSSTITKRLGESKKSSPRKPVANINGLEEKPSTHTRPIMTSNVPSAAEKSALIHEKTRIEAFSKKNISGASVKPPAKKQSTFDDLSKHLVKAKSKSTIDDSEYESDYPQVTTSSSLPTRTHAIRERAARSTVATQRKVILESDNDELEEDDDDDEKSNDDDDEVFEISD